MGQPSASSSTETECEHERCNGSKVEDLTRKPTNLAQTLPARPNDPCATQGLGTYEHDAFKTRILKRTIRCDDEVSAMKRPTDRNL